MVDGKLVCGTPGPDDRPAGRLAVVCVGIRGSSNLGSLARVMTNFGLRRLVLAGGCCQADRRAYAMACHAAGVLDGLERVGSLADIAGEFGCWIGTTGNPRPGLFGEPLTPEEGGRALASLHRETPAALLLGREDNGLSNEELRMCRWIVRVPTDTRNPSMNLSHAAAVVLHAFRQASDCEARPGTGPAQDRAGDAGPNRKGSQAVGGVSVGEMERLYEHMRDVLTRVGFLHADNPERVMFTLRRILSRGGIDKREMRVLRGILSQIRWAMDRVGAKFER